MPRLNATGKKLERKLSKAKSKKYVLRLYVTGTTPGSLRAIDSVKRICDEYLQAQYDLKVIDLYRQPALARGAQIIATPTLVKKFPTPLRRMIGDLADKERVLVGLDLQKK